ncbi:AAA domain containing protein [uncultured Caudovirales phage]|uniref:AAA domain containing protein n=1 Tax=uncultured Caudovirales phage TaxID=2100421 RepID=A0A6J5MAM5_9CAUD|nr:AAA domain containing protein [uncultured Caudovirales phage]
MNRLELVKQKNPVSRADEYWETFKDNIIGQEQVKDNFKSLFDTLYYSTRFGGMGENSILGAVLLCGPTGTGKGEFARALAKTFHKSQRNLLTISLGDFHSSHEAARLIGAPPGYLGHRETQPLLAQSRINSVASDHCGFSFILWDEVEKAHPDVFNVLLNILDRASLRTGDGNLVNFERTFHIFTSNLGNKYEADAKSYLLKEQKDQKAIVNAQKRAINNFFRKEFLGRITDTYFFENFTDKNLDEIYNLEIAKIFNRACSVIHTDTRTSIVEIESSSRVVKEILNSANTKEFGAREIKYQIQKYLYPIGLKALDEEIIAYHATTGPRDNKEKILYFSYKNDKFQAELKPTKNADN